MPIKPKCIIVTGRPGSGKTTLAKRLAEQLWMPVISRDEIKEGYVNTFDVKHDQLPDDTNALVSHLFFEIVQQHLAGKISVAIEAAFQHKVWEARLPHIFEIATPIFVVCTVDEMLAAGRHLQRGLKEPKREFFHGDKRVAIYRETGELASPGDYVAPDFSFPTLYVSTEAEYAPSLDDIVNFIQASGS